MGGGGGSNGEPKTVQYPMKPIGWVTSCFSQRNGTPRQPLLVPSARSIVQLRNELSGEYLDGLQGYSHCWVLYLFHQNTDFQKLWSDSFDGCRAKIRVPRLNGGKMGTLATRSPHRPCPIGLSVARIIAVDGANLVLGGADIVDGSPVLDIKPYVPFCDSVANASCPDWVAREIVDDPLSKLSVEVPSVVRDSLHVLWQDRTRNKALYPSFDDYLNFVREALSRDIRSVTQRVKVPTREQKGLSQTRLVDSAGQDAVWHVLLDGIDISYDLVSEEGRLILRSCSLPQ